MICIDHEHIFKARDLNAILVLPVIDANLKIFYDKCWQKSNKSKCRYVLARIPVETRVCNHCDEIDESHVLINCPKYDSHNELTIAINETNPSFQDVSVLDKLIQLMSNPIYYRLASKAICYILKKGQ